MRERLEAAGIDRCSEPSKGRPQPKLFLLLFFYPTLLAEKTFIFLLQTTCNLFLSMLYYDQVKGIGLLIPF